MAHGRPQISQSTRPIFDRHPDSDTLDTLDRTSPFHIKGQTFDVGANGRAAAEQSVDWQGPGLGLEVCPHDALLPLPSSLPPFQGSAPPIQPGVAMPVRLAPREFYILCPCHSSIPLPVGSRIPRRPCVSADRASVGRLYNGPFIRCSPGRMQDYLQPSL